MYAPAVEQEKKFTLEDIQEIVAFQKDAENLGNYLVLIANPKNFLKDLLKLLKS